MPGLNVHIYPSPFTNESRMLIMATWEPGLQEREVVDEGREVIRIRRSLGDGRGGAFWKTVRTLEWSWRILHVLKSAEIACVNCHSLAVLPLGVWLKRRHKAKLVYDTHELETETSTMRGPVRWVARLVEKAMVRRVDALVAVSRSIATWYAGHYPRVPVTVIRNVPESSQESVEFCDLKARLAVPPGALLFVYQGVLSAARGIEILLSVFSRAEQDRHIVFIGFGPLKDAVQEAARRHSNIHFHPGVPPDQVRPLTAGADVGIHLIENTCLNHYYCLPNKIWEYLNAGLPVVVSDFPEMAAVVREFDCGWTCPVEADSALSLINGLTAATVADRKHNTISAKTRFGWHLEEPALLGVYRGLGFLGAAASP
jgi:glycosyltransferase involved in cell wall biosynthesis